MSESEKKNWGLKHNYALKIYPNVNVCKDLFEQFAILETIACVVESDFGADNIITLQ